MLGTVDAVVIGMGAMVGAGVFAVLAPAARTAGGWLPLALVIAGVVAYCNATSSARLAACHPQWGGTYVYGRERLGAGWGYVAGWAFVVGKVASCAAMALTFGVYVWPGEPRVGALALVAVMAAVDYRGVRLSVRVVRVLLVVVLAVLALVVVVAWGSGAAEVARLVRVERWHGLAAVLSSAGMLFFAFAGYARIGTLGAEVRDPERVIPRAVGWALGIVLVVYGLVVASALAVLGPGVLSRSSAPLADVVEAGGFGSLVPVVAAGAAVACAGVLLSLMLGTSRTVAVMAADGHLPGWLGVVHSRSGAPHRAVVAVGAVVAVIVVVADVRGAIGFSAFGVLLYYAVANASALRLGPAENRPFLAVPVVGLVGCVVLAFCLPLGSVLGGVLVIGAGAGVFVVRRWWSGELVG
ncbi:amino acid/polyamine/organocation transporter (APC superfamily) [Actinorugispora endophytica]|uniref:Amino acid/polyamine/organocation transporter (APC superfamily) n=1 Tax=Actinorugispora endophytica TaxID=1605990 RepID=A0A4R6UU84_9ACTN|nr:amino acid/polyamine/organocation transporter (APC superfamily) [Actinorugispora endophytica]